LAKVKDKSGAGITIRQVRTKEDRKRPSVFLRLKAEEAFKGHALFEPDVELKDNPWYFEYFSHYDKQANQYVPCSGAKCPFCAANDNPSTRVLSVWYFPAAANEADKIKVFEFNYSTTNDLIDEAEDSDGMLGKAVRVKRLNDGGDYKVRISTDKALTKKELEKALKEAGVKFPNGLVALVERQLQAQMERLKALNALEDDDEDEEDDDEPTTSKKGKPVASNSSDDDDDDDDEEDDDDDEDEDSETEGMEDVEFEILSVSKKKNSITVEHEDEKVELVGDEDLDVSDFKKGDTVTVSADYDEDEETWTLTSISSEVEEEDEDEEEDDDDDSEEEDEDSEEEDAGEISGAVFEVVKVQEKDDIFDLKNEDGKVKMWLGEGVDVDYDEIKKGVSVQLDAMKDDEDDWIITAISVAKKGKSKTKK